MSLDNPLATGTEASAAKYLSFILDGCDYGVGILKVREIIAIQDITPLPGVPECVQGVINLRGRIIPIVDLRKRLGMHAREFDASTCIIVIDVDCTTDNTQIGCIVDTVSEVLNVTDGQIEPPPDLGARFEIAALSGIARIEERGKVVSLLDIDQILSCLDLPPEAEVPS